MFSRERPMDRDVAYQALLPLSPIPVLPPDYTSMTSLGTTEIKALAQETVARVLSELKLEFGKEKSLSAHLDEGTEDVARGKETGGVLRCLEHEGARRLLSLLQLLPHGVVKMSHDLEGLVSPRFLPTSDSEMRQRWPCCRLYLESKMMIKCSWQSICTTRSGAVMFSE